MHMLVSLTFLCFCQKPALIDSLFLINLMHNKKFKVALDMNRSTIVSWFSISLWFISYFPVQPLTSEKGWPKHNLAICRLCTKIIVSISRMALLSDAPSLPSSCPIAPGLNSLPGGCLFGRGRPGRI